MIKLSILILLQYNLFLNAIRLTKMCDKAFNKSFLSFFIFLIDIQLRKCAKLQRTLFFNALLYKQEDGASMDSLLGPTLANTFVCFYEKKIVTVFWWIETGWSRSYVDDCFFIFLSFKMLAWLFHLSKRGKQILFFKMLTCLLKEINLLLSSKPFSNGFCL